MMRWSLVHGVVPGVVVVGAFGVIAAGFRWSHGRLGVVWRIGAVVGCAMMLVAGVMRMLFARYEVVEYRWPTSFYVWVAVVVFLSVLCLVEWRHRPQVGRVWLLASIMAGVVFAASLVNAHYAYFPTIESVFGVTAAHEVSMADVARLQGQGDLPHGVVVSVSLPASTAVFEPRAGQVYLPPAWFRRDRPALPVVLLLAGTPGHMSDWTRAGNADRTVDRFARAHDGVGPVLVMADSNGSFWGDTECVDRPGQEAETYLTVDVAAAVRERFGVGEGQWGVVGSSEGGTCAVMLALRHPDRFRAFADFSGEAGPTLGSHRTTVDKLFAGSEDRWRASDPASLLAAWHDRPTAGWFEVGTRDRDPRRATVRLARVGHDAGFDTQLVVRSGAHNFTFWAKAFENALGWLVDHLTV